MSVLQPTYTFIHSFHHLLDEDLKKYKYKANWDSPYQGI